MSADSPRRSGSRVTRQSGGVGATGSGQVIVPQPVTDPSIIDSVTGFINEVVPQAYTSTLPGDFKETITWARFESADINDPTLFPDNTSETTLPLLLVLGYNSGVQVWSILANGEATEVLSWSQGSVRTLRILPSPVTNALHRIDTFAPKRPLVALCDSAGPGPGPPFCSVSFISLKGGDQVKSIKFKNPVCDVVANRRSVVITFLERIAVFDACTLEDRLSVTSCYPSPGPNANPVALGSRWLAFAEKKLIAWQRSSGTIGGVGAQSYTATVLHAAQTLGRGLRGLSETVASSLSGPRNSIGGQVGCGLLGSSPPTLNGTDHNTPGIVTVLDLESSSSRHNGSDDSGGNSSGIIGTSGDGVVAHFIAHNEAIVALEFDPSGMLLLTADKRGHDFHVFRLQPHPGGSSLAAVHHLYVLHRGDTTAKVQDVAFSCDSRWVAVSTMRGTTHVFPLTPYGGPVGVRTHGSPHVVNRLSRFHRSAGLSADGRSSPVPSPESPPCLPTGPHANPRLPPYPHAAVQGPLAQLRQSPHPAIAPSGALDLSLRVCATFAPPRAWLLDSHSSHIRDGSRDSNKVSRKAVDSLFIMACHGNLVQYDLEPKPVTVVPREKVCDDTLIDLEVEARAQWLLQRSPHSSEVLPPLPSTNPLLCCPDTRLPLSEIDSNSQSEERWLSQVEIVTHAGPHRRLWMGPQITFKTYNVSGPGSSMSLQDVEAIEVGTVPISRPARSNPVNMPAGARPVVPVLIESGSGSSFEQTPHLLEVYGADSGEAENWTGQGDSRLREDLADAMLESPGVPSREKGQRRCIGLLGGGGLVGEGRVVRGGGNGPVRRVVNPGGLEITMSSDGEEPDMEQEDQDLPEHHWEAVAIPATAPVIPVPPIPDSFPHRELVTTIAAAELVKTSTASCGLKSKISVSGHLQGHNLSSKKDSICGRALAETKTKGNTDKKEGYGLEECKEKERYKERNVEKQMDRSIKKEERGVEKEGNVRIKGKETSVEREFIGKNVKPKGSVKVGDIEMSNVDLSAPSGYRTNRKNSVVQQRAREVESEGSCEYQKKSSDSKYEQRPEGMTVDSKTTKKTRVTPDRSFSSSHESTSQFLSEKKKQGVESVESNFSERSVTNFERKSPEKQSIFTVPPSKASAETSVSIKKNKKKTWNLPVDEDKVQRTDFMEAEQEQHDQSHSLSSAVTEGQKLAKRDHVDTSLLQAQKSRKTSKIESEVFLEELSMNISKQNKKQKNELISNNAVKIKKRMSVDETVECVAETDISLHRGLESVCDDMQSVDTSVIISKDARKKVKAAQETACVGEGTDSSTVPEPKVRPNVVRHEDSDVRNPKTNLKSEQGAPVPESLELITKTRKKGAKHSAEPEGSANDRTLSSEEDRKKSLKCEVGIDINRGEGVDSMPESAKKGAKMVQETNFTACDPDHGKNGSIEGAGCLGDRCKGDLFVVGKKKSKAIQELEYTPTEMSSEPSVSKSQKKRGKVMHDAEAPDICGVLSREENKDEVDVGMRKDEPAVRNRKKGAKGNQEAALNESSTSIYEEEFKYSKSSDQTAEMAEGSPVPPTRSCKKGGNKTVDDGSVVGLKSKKKSMKDSQETKEDQPTKTVTSLDIKINVCQSQEVMPVLGSTKKGKRGGSEFQDSNDFSKENDSSEVGTKNKKKGQKQDDTLHDAVECLAHSHDSLHDAVECLDSHDTLHDAVECLLESHETLHDAVECLVDSRRSELEIDLGDAAKDVDFSESESLSSEPVASISKRQVEFEINLPRNDEKPPSSESVQEEYADDDVSQVKTRQARTKSVDSEPLIKTIQKGWKIDKETEASKEVDDFPALPTKKSSSSTKKAWNVSQETSARSTSVWGFANVTEACTESAERQALQKAAQKSMDLQTEQLTCVENQSEQSTKPKRGWELPGVVEMTSTQSKGKVASTVSAPDVDVDKLTFEDLEAIVDAACKEEEAKTEKLCLKENKSGKKVDGVNAQSLKKVKGKENHGSETLLDSENAVLGAADVEKIESPKCAEEPIKSPEKLVSTPSKGSKAQRRKGRR